MPMKVYGDSAGGFGVRRWNYEDKLQGIDVWSVWLRWHTCEGTFSRARGHASKKVVADTWDVPSSTLSRFSEALSRSQPIIVVLVITNNRTNAYTVQISST